MFKNEKNVRIYKQQLFNLKNKSNRKVLDPIYDIVEHLHNPKHSHSPRNSPRSLFIDQLKEIELTSLSCPVEASAIISGHSPMWLC